MNDLENLKNLKNLENRAPVLAGVPALQDQLDYSASFLAAALFFGAVFFLAAGFSSASSALAATLFYGAAVFLAAAYFFGFSSASGSAIRSSTETFFSLTEASSRIKSTTLSS